MKVNSISFSGRPNNYKKIDNFVSRSAQPEISDYSWLKQHGVTDIVNFRTNYYKFEHELEKQIVENLGMKYHQIESITSQPNESNIKKFIDIVNKAKKENGKIHIHCKAGADRTGMYSYIYESLNNISTQGNRIKEWITMGHNTKRFPDLLGWTVDYVNNLIKYTK